MSKIYTFGIIIGLLFPIKGFSQTPYCTPVYTGGCSSGVGLRSFRFGDIVEDNMCKLPPDPNFELFTATTEIPIGIRQPLEVSAIPGNTYLKIWIDFNDNHEFEDSEVVLDTFLGNNSSYYYTLEITIPQNVSIGLRRMRFRTNSVVPPPDACSPLVYGNAGDFYITITNLEAPEHAVNVYPPDGAQAVLPETNLIWQAGNGWPPDGYHLVFGSNNPPTNIESWETLAQPLYNPAVDLQPATTYYWSVIPYNDAGQDSTAAVWSFTTIGGYGKLTGVVAGQDGNPVGNAVVFLSGPGLVSETTDASGHYEFNDIPAGNYSMLCTAGSYNDFQANGIHVAVDSIRYYSIDLTRPEVSVNTEEIHAILNPGESDQEFLQISNSGTGVLNWNASISYAGSNEDWLSLPMAFGTVNPGSQEPLALNLSSAGLTSGTSESATLIIHTSPDIGTFEIPVTLDVLGPELNPVIQAYGGLVDSIAQITWDYAPSAGFEYFEIRRNGFYLDTISNQNSYSGILPAPGIYEYCVFAHYSEGYATPACCSVNYPMARLLTQQDQLQSHQWSNMNKVVSLRLFNIGNGAMSFEFSDYTDKAAKGTSSYCTASVSNQDEYISRVQVATIDHSSGWAAYNDYTSFATDMMPGAGYPVTVTIGPPNYSGDIAGVWIDYNHDFNFDNNEFTALSGSSLASGIISVPANAIPGVTTMRVRLQYNSALTPCGTQSYGEVEDYSINIVAPSFISSIVPASGFIPEGESREVHLTFSSTGMYADSGVYTNSVSLATNDPSNALISIPATMFVNIAPNLQGRITSCVTGFPLSGVLVDAGIQSTLTNDSGYYSMYLDPDVYMVKYSKFGYNPDLAFSVDLTGGDTVCINKVLSRILYPPAKLEAVTSLEGDSVVVSWPDLPKAYQLAADDGSAEKVKVLSNPYSYAVKFTPGGYPATLSGVRFYSAYANTPGIEVKAFLIKASQEGLPGLVIDSASVLVNHSGWFESNKWNAILEEGNFFIALSSESASSVPVFLGSDNTLPASGTSYIRNNSDGNGWQVKGDENFMIQALVNSPREGGDNQSFEDQFEPNDLQLFRVSGFAPNEPTQGVWTLIGNNVVSPYISGFHDWIFLPQGWYAYVIEVSTICGNSFPVYSNIVYNKINASLGLSLTSQCDSLSLSGVQAILRTKYEPADSLMIVVPASGSLVFTDVPKGDYLLEIRDPRFKLYSDYLALSNDTSLSITLEPRSFPPRNLIVSDTTLEAFWDPPLMYELNEDFEGAFPPSGWEIQSQGTMPWMQGEGNSQGIPPHTHFALGGENTTVPGNNGCCDYLISPSLDLSLSGNFHLLFQSYHSGNGQASVELSTDGGINWILLGLVNPSSSWQQQDFDLSAYSGVNSTGPIKIAFHSDDLGGQAGNWTVDDIIISSDQVTANDYYVFVDGAIVGNAEQTQWVFDPQTMNYGWQYTISVANEVCNSVSDLESYTFTCHYLDPARNLIVTDSSSASGGIAILTWDPPVYGTSLYSYKLYRNDSFLIELDSTTTQYLDSALTTGTYCYELSVVYDLVYAGFPGQFDESILIGPVCSNQDYGQHLPYLEDFSSGEFDTLFWNVGQNWLVDENSDNPVPAAKFRWDPLMSSYSSSLQSNWFNSILSDTTQVNSLWLDFDMKLEDQNSTGSEKLSVEVWTDSSWVLVGEFMNDGSFDWENHHLDIAELCLNKLFKLRFRANGSLSSDIVYWAVDNIHLYTSIALYPPQYLTAEVVNTDGLVELQWSEPAAAGNNNGYGSNGSRSISNTLLLYNVYRSSGFIAGDTAGQVFTLLSSIDTSYYLDASLGGISDSCYSYYVTAIYDQGESLPSNVDSICLYTGLRFRNIQEAELYPNPAMGILNIRSSREIRSLMIYSSQGRLVRSMIINQDKEIQLDVSGLNSGMYMLRLLYDNEESSWLRFSRIE